MAHSDATRAKISAARKGRASVVRHTPEAIEKIRAWHMGRTIPAEVRAKISASKRGQPAARGWRHTTAAKAKMSVAKLGIPRPGRTESPAAREAKSVRMRANPATYAHLLEAARHKTPETRQKIAERLAARLAAHPGPFRDTTLERILIAFLDAAGFVVEPQRHFGRAVVDAYLPDYHLACEADGEYWHNRPGRREKDAARDAELLRRFSLPVVRFTEAELRAIATVPMVS